MPKICVSKLCVEISNKPIIQDINMTIPEGCIVGLIGPNGAGKSTTVRSILGLEKWSSGELWVEEEPILPADSSWKRLLGYIPEEPVLYDELTAIEHMRWIAVGYGLPANVWKKQAVDLLTKVKLDHVLDQTPDTFSKGMRQRLQIAMARLHDASLLIADEPFYGLDPAGTRFLKETLLSLKKEGKSVLLATHSLEIAQGICDTFYVLFQGQILASGTKTDLANQCKMPEYASLETIFLTLVEQGKTERDCGVESED